MAFPLVLLPKRVMYVEDAVSFLEVLRLTMSNKHSREFVDSAHIALMTFAKENRAPFELVKQVAATGRLPVVNFAAGGVATPADAALMMLLGADGVFVGSGIFKSSDPAKMARAIVKATASYDNPKVLAQVSRGLGAAMKGLEISAIPAESLMAGRG